MNTNKFSRALALVGATILLSSSTATAAFVPKPSASDGTYSGYVRVTWSASSDAKYGYFVYRSTTKNFSNRVKLGRTTKRYWNDTKAGAARNYYYWVCPIYKKKGSTYCYWYNKSKYDDGNRYVYVPTPSVAQGKSNSYVYLSWSKSSQSIYGYYVYRGTSSSFSSASRIGTTSTSKRYFYDYSATPGRKYYYWIVVRCWNFSVYTSSRWRTGYRAVIVPTPSGYAYSRGVNYLYWSSVSGAKKYKIKVGTSSNFSAAKFIGTITSTRCTISGAVSGHGYYYWVCPVDSRGAYWYNTSKWKYIRTL